MSDIVKLIEWAPPPPEDSPFRTLCQRSQKRGEIKGGIDLKVQRTLDSITASHITSNIKRLDETKLNKALRGMPPDMVAKLVRKQLPLPNRVRPRLLDFTGKRRISNGRVHQSVTDLGLLDEPCLETRLRHFIAWCRLSNFTENTTKTYVQMLRHAGVFGPTADDYPSHIKPDSVSFDDSGRHHVRIVSIADYTTYFKWLAANLSRYTAPLLVAAYTGLRSFELLQMTMYTLFQLKTRQPNVKIRRKHTVAAAMASEAMNYWTPVYNTHLNTLIDRLVDDLYADEYVAYRTHNIDTQLFYVTPKTLGNRVRTTYLAALNHLPPHGFGVHSFRNMVAMVMATCTSNVVAIQQFLQHKKLKQTRTYIKADFSETAREFERLTQYELQTVRSGLQQIVNSDSNTTTTRNQPRNQPRNAKKELKSSIMSS